MAFWSKKNTGSVELAKALKVFTYKININLIDGVEKGSYTTRSFSEISAFKEVKGHIFDIIKSGCGLHRDGKTMLFVPSHFIKNIELDETPQIEEADVKKL